MERARMGGGIAGVRAVRRLDDLAGAAAGVRRGCRGVGVAVVLALAAACVIVPGAQALDVTTEIAVQANTGVLWTWTAAGAADTGLGMKRGTSPSVDPFGVGSDHLVVFQANTGDLWTTGSGGHGDSGVGMAAGTSPAVNRYGVIAFQANTGVLWNVDPVPEALSNYGLAEGMAAGTSPYIDSYGGISFQASGGLLSGWPIDDGSNLTMAAGTSPSGNDEGYGAAQGSNGDLWTGVSDYTDQQLAMAAGTSPAVNDVGFVGDGHTGEVAFQGSNGDLWITGSHGTGDAHLKMMPGTSPSIDDGGEVAFQGNNGDLWIWKLGSSAVDLGLGMMAGTSPSISRDPGSIPVNVIAGGPGNDRLNGTVRDDLMFGGRGNDVIHGRAGNEVIYGGPGNDRIDGGPGNDRIDGGPGNDRIVDHRGATVVLPQAGINRVDLADGRGNDRVRCAPGSTNHIVADRRDQIARSCRGKRSTIRYKPVRQPRSER